MLTYRRNAKSVSTRGDRKSGTAGAPSGGTARAMSTPVTARAAERAKLDRSSSLRVCHHAARSRARAVVVTNASARSPTNAIASMSTARCHGSSPSSLTGSPSAWPRWSPRVEQGGDGDADEPSSRLQRVDRAPGQVLGERRNCHRHRGHREDEHRAIGHTPPPGSSAVKTKSSAAAVAMGAEPRSGGRPAGTTRR